MNKRIEIDQKVAFGKPVVAGTRIAVEFILQLLATGWTVVEVLEEYSNLKEEDVFACIDYARQLVEERSFYPLKFT